MVIQMSGSGTSFSYTVAAGVTLAITGRAGYDWNLSLNAGASGAAPYVYGFLSASTDLSEDRYAIKTILTSGNSVAGGGSNINSYGVSFYGIEL